MRTQQIEDRAFIDVLAYPGDQLRVNFDHVDIAVTYKRQWDDGFGARGWKLDATIGDPAIIASTRVTGERINTSVFVHDVLDHLLSGFGISGHRSEAMALIQLSNRTGSSPLPDYRQMVDEDILNGVVNGESMIRFLPADLVARLPPALGDDGKKIINYLCSDMGREKLTCVLIDHFNNIGKTGKAHAQKSWTKLGLGLDLQAELGMAIQRLLERLDSYAEEKQIENLKGFITVNSEIVSLRLFEFETGDQQYKLPVIEDTERL